MEYKEIVQEDRRLLVEGTNLFEEGMKWEVGPTLNVPERLKERFVKYTTDIESFQREVGRLFEADKNDRRIDRVNLRHISIYWSLSLRNLTGKFEWYI